MTEHWFSLALITGIFWGGIALSIHTPWKMFNQSAWYIRLTVPLQQFVFNFICGFAGWYCLHLFEARHLSNSWSNLTLLVIAIAGISGRLAHVMWAASDIIAGWIKKQMKKHLEGNGRSEWLGNYPPGKRIRKRRFWNG